MYDSSLERAKRNYTSWDKYSEGMAESEWARTEYNKKLLITSYVFRKIYEHILEGGSFRDLIYERLGFDSDAYFELCVSGGVDISNVGYDVRELSGFFNKYYWIKKIFRILKIGLALIFLRRRLKEISDE